ncbi:TraR/DksA C4-type zinc finger protein [Acidithiobacillus sp. M4-SHS-6]|uniref:TraR/DksA C4-type zinc finger protein n=1 Tax=Acidithiobacillus sp. M4-SHS-6 TaxID=3383024 RepID=UPI0039BEC831
MPDIFEQASDLEDLERSHILSKHRNRQVEMPDEADGIRYCLDCGDEIPEARVLAINAVRCVHCAGIRERRLKQGVTG